MRWRPFVCIILLAALLAQIPTSAGSAAPTVEGPFFSSEVYTTSTTCSNRAALRDAADLLDDEWKAVAQADQYILGVIPGPNNPAPNPVTINFGAVDVDVSKHDVSEADTVSNANSSWGTVDSANTNDPVTSTGSTLQDCAPRPSSLYSSSAAGRTPQWGANAGDGSTRDAVMFEFSTPVAAFGAWFGDVENPITDGVPAQLKLFDELGNVITNTFIQSDRPAPLAGDPSGRTTCGGGQTSDALACGNQATKFIGFTYEQPTVSRMLVVVGDDDSCDEFPTDCGGVQEHLSFIGPQLAVFHTGEIEVTKTEVGGTASDPWTFTVTAENGCTLPEDPFELDVPAGGGSVTFSGLPVTLDGTEPCLYSVSESTADGWALDADVSSSLVDLEVQNDSPTELSVTNRFTPPPPTTTTTSTTVAPTTTSTTVAPGTTTTVPPTSTTTTSTSTTVFGQMTKASNK